MTRAHLTFLLAAAGLAGGLPAMRPEDVPEETDEERRLRLEHLDAVHREWEETDRRRRQEWKDFWHEDAIRQAEWKRQRALPLDQPCEKGGEHEIELTYSARTDARVRRCQKCGGEEALPPRPLSRQQRRAQARGKNRG